MAKSYLNTKYNGKVETVDHLDSNDFTDQKEFRKEKKRLLSEYSLAGFPTLYWSQRSTKDY